MKNLKFIFAALASFAAFSCEKESLPQSTPESDLIPLVLTTGNDTKTSLQTDGSIHWSDEDQISVIDNGILDRNEKNIHSFTISNIRGSKATFSGNVRNSTTAICAVYPADLVVSGDVGGALGYESNRDITVRIPSEQTAKIGTFNDNLNISVAKTSVSYVSGNALPSTTSITFKNVCALLSFTMPSTLPGTITSVTIASSVAIAGDMNIDYSGDTPKFKSLSNPVKQITMVGNFTAGKTYWFVLAPVTLNGISIIVHDSEENIYIKSRSGQIKLNQGTYRSLGTLNFDKMRPIIVSSEHTYGESEMLTGTKLNMSLPEDLTAVSLSVKNRDGKEVRKIDDLSSYSNGVIINTKTKDTDWPYLPKGDYTVSGSYTSSASGVIEISDYPFKISKPSARTITYFEPYTSYTNRSNSLDGSTIYIKFKVNVSDEILTNSAYTSLFKSELNGSATSAVSLGSGVLESTLANQAWKAHTITSVKCSFDGSSVNDYNPSSTVHVTGIPYSYNFKDVSDINAYKSAGWTMNGNVSIENILGSKGFALSRGWRERTGGSLFNPTYTSYKYIGYVVSPAFHIPNATSLEANVLTSGYVSVGRSRDVKGYIGVVESSTTQCGKSISYNTNCSMNPWEGNSGSNVWHDLEMNATNNRVCVACDQAYDDNSTMNYYLNKVSFRYAE